MAGLISREQAWELLTAYNRDAFHLHHALVLEGVMRYFANELGYGAEADFWSRAGLLHDLDFEQYPQEIACIIVEPVAGNMNCIPPQPEFLPGLRALCDEFGALLIIDEVVCGLGRTGKWFGYQHFNVKPDIVTMAKGVAAGYAPISCTVTTEEVFQDFIADPSDRDSYFRDISTFGGCTAGPAAGYANINYMEEHNVLDNVVKMGDYLMDGLKALEKKYEIIGDVRGKGLFCGLELVKNRTTKEPVSEAVAGAVVGECMKQGVIIGKTSRCFRELNNTLCLAPALIATTAEIDEILKALDNAFQVVKA